MTINDTVKEYSGSDFVKIMTGNRDHLIVNEYLNYELANIGANLKSQLDQARQRGEPETRRMLPLYYNSIMWKSTNGSDKPLPFYTIVGPVNIEEAQLEWTLQIYRCRFTDRIQLTGLKTAKISFDDCLFEKGLSINNSEINNLEFSEIRGLFNLKIIDSTIGDLVINGDRTISPSITRTKLKSLSLNSINS